MTLSPLKFIIPCSILFLVPLGFKLNQPLQPEAIFDRENVEQDGSNLDTRLVIKSQNLLKTQGAHDTDNKFFACG